MKREFLQNFKVGNQALPKNVIDAIMSENGRDIEAAKSPMWTTIPSRTSWKRPRNFNSRPRVGGDIRLTRSVHTNVKFQFSPPGGGRQM